MFLNVFQKYMHIHIYIYMYYIYIYNIHGENMHEYREKGMIRLRDMEGVGEEKVEGEFDQTHYIHV